MNFDQDNSPPSDADKLTLSVGHNLDSEGLLVALRAQIDELGPRLTWDVSRHDSRATSDDDSVEFEDVSHVEGDIYSLSYSYDWSAFHGCKDADRSDTAYRSIRFEYRDGRSSFYFEPYDERDPDDEF